MPNHFYLPQLTEANLSTPPEHGHWYNNDKKIILGISNAILVDQEALTKGVSSIPDIWARPLLFQSAVRKNSNHPLHSICVQEWRGLMSLIALSKIAPVLRSLQFEPVTLNNEKLSVALKNLKPDPVRLEENTYYEWTDILLIKYDGIPLGAFSPTTLVFTGSDYRKKLPDIFPYKDKNGYLKPPEEPDDLRKIGSWITNIKLELQKYFFSGQVNKDHLIIANINHLFDDWLTDIKKQLNIPENTILEASDYKVADESIEINKPAGFLRQYHVYKTLLRPIDYASPESVKHVSDVAMLFSRNLLKYEQVIIINEKLLEDDIKLWGETRSKPLGATPKDIIDRFFNQASGNYISTHNIGEVGGLWIRPELYFLSEDLIRSNQDSILEANEDSGNFGTKFVLPFKDTILNFFSPKDIAETLKPSYKEENGVVRFSFSLYLKGNKHLRVEKTYRPKNPQIGEGAIKYIETPILEIFPNYLGKSWRRYYLFQSHADTYSFTPLFGDKTTVNQGPQGTIQVRDRIRDIKYAQNERSGEVGPMSFSKDSGSEFSTIEQKVKISEISGDDCFPESIMIGDSKNKQFGLIFLKNEFDPVSLQHEWKIGIDFGTSNTNVYKKRSNADRAEQWTFDFPQYTRSLLICGQEAKKFILREYFFPTEKVVFPIPSTLKIYNFSVNELMLLDYFIYFPNEYKFSQDVLSEIKWEGEGDRKTKLFLKSLLFLLFIEVVKEKVSKVELACSYPKAFSDLYINLFKLEWKDVFAEFFVSSENNNPLLLTKEDKTEFSGVRLDVETPKFETEGIAAGEFFASALTISNIYDIADKEIAAICLDVGGGTTDISIWHGNAIKYDASVLLAGRQISQFIQRNARVREMLFSKDAAIALGEKKNEPLFFSARMNLILKKEEKEIHKKLRDYHNNKDILWLRQIIAIEFCALSFFSAEACIAANERAHTLLDRISSNGIKLHWGGNAAKLINWIDFGSYAKDGNASKMLNAVFFNCLNDKSLAGKAIKPGALVQLQSPWHKSEASGGLVVMDLKQNTNSRDENDRDENSMDMDADNQDQPIGIICGENIELSDRSLAFYETISNRVLFEDSGRTRFKSTSLERLSRFIEIVNFFGVKISMFNDDTKLILSDREKSIIKDGVLKQFIRMESQKQDQRLIEPIFITEVKLLLEIIKDKMV